MIVDSSALIAVLRSEPDADRFAAAMLNADHVRVSIGTLIEARIIAERESGGAADLDALLHLLKAEILDLDYRQAGFALEGFQRFGKGRHPAGLNLGDLFAYDLARSLDESLLFKGNDFARTDLRSALP